METAKILDKSHPSFGCSKAVFIFVSNTPAGVRMLSVEATNEWAVAAIERLVLKDQRVNKVCSLISVTRNYASFGVRNDLMEEVPYVDFMTDIVDNDRLLDDSVVSSCFAHSLSPEEREYVSAKMDSEFEVGKNVQKAVRDAAYLASKDRAQMEDSVPNLRLLPKFSRPSEDAISALVNLGFKKFEVNGWASQYDAEGKSIQEVIKAGCIAMAKILNVMGYI